ncbi:MULTISPECIES: ArsR/SmtB family transcription factor [Streptomyces]|uniref:ArsR/SmtB family transcription factor n=1 Tax=Streptomyces TaxID=1883 RepID=UPI00163BC33C|nr:MULTISPECIES: helix-turn-helix domain-containing protein [Streptomyces]MBC2878665.1 helix-turn-helix transcriptional regulator [Streptomyces sp. TYQ1024]UBI35111.1 helix-turn-helix domain-containing protein [Streptomyces mobaraensis]UKW27705.1 helix-turn-helix domain-containing protein [Streptomyces sp. TYQ1024]
MSAQTRSRAGESGREQEPAGARAAHHRPAPVHTDPAEVSLEAALLALADPVRRTLVRELASAGDWVRPCGSFDVPVTKATLSRHFTVLREAGLLEQRDAGPKRLNRLRRPEFDARFPGLLALVLREDDGER